jgi:hypothetical protein
MLFFFKKKWDGMPYAIDIDPIAYKHLSHVYVLKKSFEDEKKSLIILTVKLLLIVVFILKI